MDILLNAVSLLLGVILGGLLIRGMYLVEVDKTEARKRAQDDE
jgi:hypothetical protein|tara:strand:+ start:503 stop:631 length:129 start_codon:yes stop_codon:yes gene_type:complete